MQRGDIQLKKIPKTIKPTLQIKTEHLYTWLISHSTGLNFNMQTVILIFPPYYRISNMLQVF